jgi:hypothetical protein
MGHLISTNPIRYPITLRSDEYSMASNQTFKCIFVACTKMNVEVIKREWCGRVRCERMRDFASYKSL